MPSKTKNRNQDLVANPVQNRPDHGKKPVLSKSGRVVATRTDFSRPTEPGVGFENVPANKKAPR